jgi:hypothetical protein
MGGGFWWEHLISNLKLDNNLYIKLDKEDIVTMYNEFETM